MGSSIPFAVDCATRERIGDPRPSITERYSDRTAYLEAVRSAAKTLAKNRYLLDEDIEHCVDMAGRRYDAVLCRANAP